MQVLQEQKPALEGQPCSLQCSAASKGIGPTRFEASGITVAGFRQGREAWTTFSALNIPAVSGRMPVEVNVAKADLHCTQESPAAMWGFLFA